MAVSNQSYSFDIARNLAYWMSWAYVIYDGEDEQRVLLTGDVRYVFDRWYAVLE
jgi:hypothetical protein